APARPPRLRMGEQVSAHSLAAPLLRHGHLLELKGRLVERLERNGAHYSAIGKRAKVLPRRVICELLAGDGQAKRLAQHRLAQAHTLAVEVRAKHGLDDGDVGFAFQTTLTDSLPAARPWPKWRRSGEHPCRDSRGRYSPTSPSSLGG